MSSPDEQDFPGHLLHQVYLVFLLASSVFLTRKHKNVG